MILSHQRVGDKYVVTGSPGNVDMVGNGFRFTITITITDIITNINNITITRLHGGGGVYLSDKDVQIGSDPYMYWQTNLADQVSSLKSFSEQELFETSQAGLVLRCGREQRGLQMQRSHVLGQHAWI